MSSEEDDDDDDEEDENEDAPMEEAGMSFYHFEICDVILLLRYLHKSANDYGDPCELEIFLLVLLYFIIFHSLASWKKLDESSFCVSEKIA